MFVLLSAQLFLCFVSICNYKSATATEAPRTANCEPFPHVFLKNGQIISLDRTRLLFKCDDGYFLTSPQTVRCKRGQWTSLVPPMCSRKENLCDDPEPIKNGKVLGKNREVGSVIMYVCNPGFTLMGTNTRSCSPNRLWSGLTPVCMNEAEPLSKVAERLESKFIEDVGVHSSDSALPLGRKLDKESLKNGLELVILLDRSSSVDPNDFKVGIRFIKFLLQRFGVKNGLHNPSGTRVAVITFASKIDILFNLDNETITGPIAAFKALDTLQAGGGGTDLKSAFTEVIVSVSEPNVIRPNAKKAMFIVSDGEPNIGSLDVTPENLASNLKEKFDYEIFTVGIGKGYNKQFLANLSSEPLLNHVFSLEKYQDLGEIMRLIEDEPPKPKPVNPARCGYIKFEENFLRSWPWLAAVFVKHQKENEMEMSFCSGTLICGEWVLTAASCLFEPSKDNREIPQRINITDVYVSMGARLLTKQALANFYVQEVSIHPEFDMSHKVVHNLALIKLNAPAVNATYSKFPFRPACLPRTDRTISLHMNVHANVSTAGWGLPPQLNNSPFVNAANLHLNRTDSLLDIVVENACKGRRRKLPKNTFCAGFGNNTCVSNMGSPLIAIDPETFHHHVIGILTDKSDCKSKMFNYYVELEKYITWINNVTDNCHEKHYMT